MNPTLRLPLSERERQIAVLIGRNLSYREIGAELGLSPHTVRAYVITMASKIDFGPDRVPEPRVAVYALVIFERYVAGEKAG